MSEQNVELVERAVEAINARDIERYLACCTENVKLRSGLRLPGGGLGGDAGNRLPARSCILSRAGR
jgi:hypothetical protein